MANNPLQDVLNLINSISSLEQSASALRGLPVIGNQINNLMTPISNIKNQVVGISDMLKMVPDLPGDWDNQIKDALSGFTSNQNAVSDIENMAVPNSNQTETQSNPLDMLGGLGAMLGGGGTSDMMRSASDFLGGMMKK